MALSWIVPNKRLLEAVQIVNSTPTKDYIDILKRLSDDSNYTENELSELGTRLKLDENALQLLVQSIEHIFKKSSMVIIKPTVLHRNLVEHLKFEQEKAEEFVKVWTEIANKHFGDLNTRKKVDQIAWQLGLETSSSNGASEVSLKSRLQLGLSDFTGADAENVTLDMNEVDLLQLYTTLETIQSKLDTLQK